MPVMNPAMRLLATAAAAGVIIGMALLWSRSSRNRSDPDGIEDVEDDAAAAESPAAAPGDELAAPAKSTDAASKEVEASVKAEFNLAKLKAFELFKLQPPKYAEAAASFSEAISLAESSSSLASQRVALYNNRSACRERIEELDLSLADCAVVLASNPMHAKVRRRRARIFEKLGRMTEALVEVCADLLIQREDFKKAMRAGREPEPPSPVENVEQVMRAVGKAGAAEVLASRGAADFGMPSTNTITQLLMTYASYGERAQQAAAEPSDAALGKETDAAQAPALKCGALLRRAEKRTYTKRYEKAATDVDAALAAYQAASSAGGSSIPPGWSPALVASLWRAVGLYRHLVHDLEGATKAYALALELETETEKRVETRVKRAGVFVDSGEMEAADVEIAAALAEDAGASDVYMHRAQLHVIRRDLVSAQKDLEKCIELAPGHVLARLRLATVLIHNGATTAAIEQHIAAAEQLAPKMSEVYQVKGEILLAKQDLAGAVLEFDKAIALDETNPVPLYNKGLALIQTSHQEAHNAQHLFEQALRVDPSCMVALMRLSELKLQLAASFDNAQEVVDMLGNAMQKCRDKDELVELSTVRCMAIAQLTAARDVGLTSFQH